MPILTRLAGLFGRKAAASAGPRADAGGVVIQSLADLVSGHGYLASSGVPVTPDSAMRVAAVSACVRILCGPPANLPLDIKRRLADGSRLDAEDEPAALLLSRRPNGWQTPTQFKRMMQAHLLLRGNAYAMIVRSGVRPVALLPLNPDRVEIRQGDDLTVTFRYQRPRGGVVDFPRHEILHLTGLTLDGLRGVSILTFAREAIGEAIAMSSYGGALFQNGARPSGILTHPGRLGPEGVESLRASLEQFRGGGEKEGRALILEEDMKYLQVSLSSVDAQWIESRRFTRTDIAMFFGVPPHMIGDVDKTTSFGTGIDSQTQGFVTFSAEDWLTIWEETIRRDLIGVDRPEVYARFNRAALVRGDIRARWDSYVKALQWGVLSPNEIRALEDLNPRAGGNVFYPPPNMTGPAGNQGEVTS